MQQSIGEFKQETSSLSKKQQYRGSSSSTSREEEAEEKANLRGSNKLLFNTNSNQTPTTLLVNMKPNVIRSTICICLAVILYTCASTIQNVNADHPENSQLMQHHPSHSQSMLFKDLSGPTSGKIQTLDVICGKNFMTVRAEFSAPFYGIVFSKGTYGQENCIYVKPNSGLTHAAFNVYYDQCGTKPDLQGKFYENTIVIQYGSDIIEAYDEAKRLRCEWFEAYEKPATFKPAIPVADLEVVEMNFQGDDIDCWMEIQEGSGPWSREVSKIVPVGQPMTIVVAINDYNGQFDMRVKSCVAHDGVQQPISLTDEYGCVLRPKMLTPFTKIKNPGGHKKATVLSYSRFLAFKFPDSMTVQIQCTVEVCRHGCADACQRVPSIAATTIQPELSLTAKWPSAPNQAAIEGPRPPPPPPKRSSFQADAPASGAIPIQPPASESVMNENVMGVPYKPARMQFSQRQPQQQQPAADDRSNLAPGIPGRLPSSLSSFHSGNELMASDDMSISDSNQQASIVNSAPQQRRDPQGFNRDQQRRATPNQDPTLPSMIDGRIPQYLVPLSNRRRPATTSTSLAGPTTTTTTTTTSTTTPAPTTSSPVAMEDNRSNPVDEAPEFSSSDDQLTRLSGAGEQQSNVNANNNNNNNGKQGDSVGDSESMGATNAEQADNKPEASQVNPTIAMMPQPNEPAAQPVEQPQRGPQFTDQASSSSGGSSPSNSDSSAPDSGNSNKGPSVQSGDEAQMDNPSNNNNNNNANSGKSDNEGSESSLKTVEVEIPANEDPVRTLISSSPPSISNLNNNNNPMIHNGPFNSVRMSNVDLSANNGYGYEGNQQQETRPGSDYKQQGYINEQVIQPRESSQQGSETNKRDKSEDNSNIEAIMAAVKNRFGARSQPQSSVQQAAPALEPPSNHYNNHQMSSVDQGQEVPANKEGAESVNPDRVLIDRSDDSSSLTEVASSSSSSSSSATSDKDSLSKPEPSGGASEPGEAVEESSPIASVDTNGGARVKPVVGTEELASGPLQIEDRIGVPAPAPASAQESLEEALLRLQHQVPQTAALVSGSQHHQEPQRPQNVAQEANKPQVVAAAVSNDRRLDNNNGPQAEVAKMDSVGEKPDVVSDRADEAAALEMKKKTTNQQANQSGPENSQQINRSQQAQNDLAQPFPNVMGQQKVIPDPSSNLNTRGSLLAQASNQDGSPNGVLQPNGAPALPKSASQQKPPSAGTPNDSQQPIQQQQQFGQISNPVAQITNVPINIGFPQGQIPTIQQLSHHQQLAYYQQQQQQQPKTIQASSTTTTTARPSRGRFSLLSPQAALQAVASRFLPKSSPSAQQLAAAAANQQQFTKQQQAQLPQVFNSMKLTPDQQQKLFAPSQQQQQQQQQSPKYFLQKQTPSQISPVQQQYLPQRYGPAAPSLQQQSPYQPMQQSGPSPGGSGLFGRLNNVAQQQQQQPLIRSRRSAMMPSGKRGSGEVGITKTFMVVTGMDLAFLPNATDTQLPPILEGRRLVEDDDIIYGVCMPVVSLTFVLTCAFWLIVFIFSFCIYMLMKSRNGNRKLGQQTGSSIEQR